jgi:hypothetical protein
MRQMEISRKTVKLDGETDSTIIYFVTTDDLTDPETQVSFEIYGIGVTILERGETGMISSMAFNKKDVFSLAELLASHLVTPVTVGDVVVDWLYAN